MRNIKKIVVHCSATKEGADIRAKDIDAMHKARGWSGIGYHFVILLDGSIEVGRPEEQQGAHVKGHNEDSIGVCMIGGLDSSLKAKDTFTKAQKETLAVLLVFLSKKYAGSEVFGHRDLSPDLNKDGKITREEWLKECPCFEVKSFFENICLENLV